MPWWNNPPNKPPPNYVRPWLTKEEFDRLQAFVDDKRRNQLSDAEQLKKCGANGVYAKACPDVIRLCKPKEKEPELICPGEKKGARIPFCLDPKPLLKPPTCPVYDQNPCAEEELMGPAVLHRKEEHDKKKKNSGAYSCFPDYDPPCF